MIKAFEDSVSAFKLEEKIYMYNAGWGKLKALCQLTSLTIDKDKKAEELKEIERLMDILGICGEDLDQAGIPSDLTKQ